MDEISASSHAWVGKKTRNCKNYIPRTEAEKKHLKLPSTIELFDMTFQISKCYNSHNSSMINSQKKQENKHFTNFQVDFTNFQGAVFL